MREAECKNRCADKENACYKRKKNSKTYWFHSYNIYFRKTCCDTRILSIKKKSNNNKNAGDKPRSERKEKTCVNICLHA